MLTGRPPFYSSNKQDIINNITSRNVPLPDYLSPDAKSLLKGLFKIKPKDRLGAKKDGEEIKNHPFFANVDFDELLKRKVSPPISFKEALNEDGFDVDFGGSQANTFNIDSSMKEKGLIFDGFTYRKPIMSLNNKREDESGNL
jgi:serine/threonine protein kinase